MTNTKVPIPMLTPTMVRILVLDPDVLISDAGIGVEVVGTRDEDIEAGR